VSKARTRLGWGHKTTFATPGGRDMVEADMKKILEERERRNHND
jgi:hypothetical protein